MRCPCIHHRVDRECSMKLVHTMLVPAILALSILHLSGCEFFSNDAGKEKEGNPLLQNTSDNAAEPSSPILKVRDIYPPSDEERNTATPGQKVGRFRRIEDDNDVRPDAGVLPHKIVIANHRDSLDDILVQSSRDTVWQNAMTDYLREFIRKLEMANSTIKAVDCTEKMCRVIIVSDSLEEIITMTHAQDKATDPSLPFNSQDFFGTAEPIGGQFVWIYYCPRPGEKLPLKSP